MVEKFTSILDNFRAKGPITLFAIIKMDDLTDKWSVLICAPWISDEESKDRTFNEIRELIKKTLTPEEASSVARIVIGSRDEHLIQELLEQKPGAYIDGPLKVNGNLIHEAHILESNKES